MKDLALQISNCTYCNLPLPHNPIVKLHSNSKIVLISQAPGIVAHKSGVPWDDKGGQNLRDWLGVSDNTFFNTHKFSVLPMGFCYPGKGVSGDLPPKKACAPLWHNKVFSNFKEVELYILIGKYAQDYYLKKNPYNTLTSTVKNFREFLPKYFVLPHPSPRNNIWQSKNSWFKQEVLPVLKATVQSVLKEY